MQTHMTRIEIDEELLVEAMWASDAQSKREAVELGLRALVEIGKQRWIRAYRGQLPWSGDLRKV
jgi:Arc/MetJ family transcription regulator